jgi:acetate kinase
MDNFRADQGGLILVLNSGSSSLKFGVYERSSIERPLMTARANGIGRDNASLEIRWSDTRPDQQKPAPLPANALRSQSDALSVLARVVAEKSSMKPTGVGHRIVHGGPNLREHQLITPQVMDSLRSASHFAPLHIPQALELLEAAQKEFPSAAHYACFDDVFHRTMPEVATHFPLPQRYFDAGIVRYGFHGLSYEALVHRFGSRLPLRAIFAHLGSGASLCAVRDGASIDTTMGLTPTGGVPMGTRCGDLDPGLVLYLIRNEKLGPDELENLFNHRSGLFALSAGESDVEALESRARQGDNCAALALEVFSVAVRKVIGSYIALLGGIDLLVFTGGIGEHSDAIRSAATKGLDFLGLTHDKIVVVPAQEEQQIARHCQRLMDETNSQLV